MEAIDLNIAIESLAGAHQTSTVCSDSRQVTPGDIFVAVPGLQVDGHDFIDQAIRQG
ncbi:MAG: UDP-N-acetylmuramoyl-tripeptide--D-alanyl-D-alanine ligase, partial [Planctomycetes bacterium]|nr:UDP-N-acetylmuramoyl-tripeptide--D-alanyl-D-alanine ligase [Planctomycetota bacterium]